MLEKAKQDIIKVVEEKKLLNIIKIIKNFWEKSKKLEQELIWKGRISKKSYGRERHRNVEENKK